MSKTEFVFPPKKILVPLDATEASRNAWTYAKALGASLGARVDGLYVKEWLFYGQYAPMMDDVRLTVEELRKLLGAGDEIKAVSGSIEGTILSWGRSLDYDLVVMGTHGATGLERLLRGSIAEAVIRSSEIPVLVTRSPRLRVRSVLAPVNFEPYAMTGLAAAARVAETFAARLEILRVVETPVYGEESGLKGARKLLADAVAGLPASVKTACRPRTMLAFGEAVERISALAEDVDLVVMAGHHKGLLGDFVLGTTTQRVLRHSRTPLLVLPSMEIRKRARPRARRSEAAAR